MTSASSIEGDRPNTGWYDLPLASILFSRERYEGTPTFILNVNSEDRDSTFAQTLDELNKVVNSGPSKGEELRKIRESLNQLVRSDSRDRVS